MDYEMAIAELKTRRDAASVAILKLDERVTKHDEIIAVLIDSLATKDDIAALRGDLRERLDRDELLDERIALYRQQVDDMREERADKSSKEEHRFNRRMSWAMLAMFVWECALTWIGTRHGK